MVKHDNIPGFWGYYVSPKGIIWTIRSRNGRGKDNIVYKITPRTGPKFTTFEIFWVRLLKQMGFSTVFISKIDGRSRKNLSRYLKDL